MSHCLLILLELCPTWPVVTTPTLLELCGAWPAVTTATLFWRLVPPAIGRPIARLRTRADLVGTAWLWACTQRVKSDRKLKNYDCQKYEKITDSWECGREHTRTHTDTRGHTRTHADTHQHTPAHAGTHGHTRAHAGTRGHPRAHADTRGHPRSHTGTRGHMRTHADTRGQTDRRIASSITVRWLSCHQLLLVIPATGVYMAGGRR